MYGYTEYEGKVTYDLWVDCGIEIVKYFQKDAVPVFLFGLSAGGMLAYQVASECSDIRGIIATCLLDQRNPIVTKKTATNPIMGTIGKSFLAFAHKLRVLYEYQ